MTQANIKSIIIGLLAAVILFLLFLNDQNSNKVLKLQSDNETLEVANQSLTAEVEQTGHRIDTVYLEKEKLRIDHQLVIKKIYLLDSLQQDSLFGLLYPSKDSANATYFHCIFARRQLVLSDSIIELKATIINKQDTMLSNKDTIISNNKTIIAQEQKKVKKWKVIAAVGWLLNLAH